LVTLRKIASIVKGKLIGAPGQLIHGVSDIRNGVPETITFLLNPKHTKLVEQTAASAVIVNDSTLLAGKNGIVVESPRLAMSKVLKIFESKDHQPIGIHPTAIVYESVKIGEKVCIGAMAMIGKNAQIGKGSIIHNSVTIGENVVLGDNVEIHAQVAVFSNVKIGNNVIIDMGTIVGSSGFGYETADGIHHKIPQIGSVVIADNVEIGANCTIDRGTITDTVIGEGTKIDNLVQVAHNVKIGKGCLIAAQTGISGSVDIGDFCIFAGQVGVNNGIKIGARSIFIGQTGVTKSLLGGKIYSGMPVREVGETNQRDAAYLKIKSLEKRLKNIEEQFAK